MSVILQNVDNFITSAFSKKKGYRQVSITLFLLLISFYASFLVFFYPLFHTTLLSSYSFLKKKRKKRIYDDKLVRCYRLRSGFSMMYQESSARMMVMTKVRMRQRVMFCWCMSYRMSICMTG